MLRDSHIRDSIFILGRKHYAADKERQRGERSKGKGNGKAPLHGDSSSGRQCNISYVDVAQFGGRCKGYHKP